MASCAACGVAIRKSDPIRLFEYWVIHRHCEGIAQDSWAVFIDQRRALAAAVRDRESIERKLAWANQDIERLQAKVSNVHVGVADVEVRVQLDAAERLVRVKQRQLQTLRDEFEDYRSASRTQPGPTLARSALERLAFGLAVGRGIYGFAALIMRCVLDTKDAAEARFALLELR